MASAALTRAAALHQALWTYDNHYRYAWLIWPQALSLLVATLVFSAQGSSGPQPTGAAWVKPVATAGGTGTAPPEEVALCNNVTADAKVRGEACDRLIKGGKLAGLQLSSAHYWRGYMNQVTNQYDAAIVDFSETLKLNPGNYFAYNGRGWMYINKNDLEKAYADFTKSLEINKNAINAIAYANRAEVLRRQSKFNEAQVDLNEAFRLDEKLQMAILVRDSLVADIKRAEEEKRKASSSSSQQATTPTPGGGTGTQPAGGGSGTQPTGDAAVRARGYAAIEDRRWPDAIAAFSTLIQAGSTVPADFDARGYALMSKQPADANGAMADFTRSIALTGHSATPHSKRAIIFFWRNQSREALSDANAAINDHKSNSAETFVLRARIHLAQSSTDEAWQDANKATELAPDSADAFLVRGLASANATRAQMEACRRPNEQDRSFKGGACSRPLNFLSAQMDFETAIKKNPKLPQAHFELGRALQDGNHPQEAINAYNEAIRLQPAYAAAYNNRGVAYAGLNRLEPAFYDYSEAIRHEPRMAVAYRNRGDLYAKANQRQEAINDYRKALDINPNLNAAADALRRLGIRP